MLKCICALTPSCRFTYCSFANTGHADIIWSVVSSSCWHSLHLLSVSGVVILWRSTSCLTLGLVLPLFRFQVLFIIIIIIIIIIIVIILEHVMEFYLTIDPYR
jgi:hypothetical protein